MRVRKRRWIVRIDNEHYGCLKTSSMRTDLSTSTSVSMEPTEKQGRATRFIKLGAEAWAMAVGGRVVKLKKRG